MSTPTFHWKKQTKRKLHFTIKGNLDASGGLWTGTKTSPNGIWKIDYSQGWAMQTHNGTYSGYDLHLGRVLVTQLHGPAEKYEMYCVDAGISSWNTNSHQGGGSTTDPYLPYSSGGNFRINAVTGLPPVPTSWNGKATATLVSAKRILDFKTWKFVLCVEINCP